VLSTPIAAVPEPNDNPLILATVYNFDPS